MSQLSRPKKALGQNFLHDQRVLNRIAQACELNSDDDIIEIGPGRGALTRLLTGKTKTLIAIERDAALYALLREQLGSQPGVSFVHEDFLAWPFPKEGRYKVVGNIPYYISTPIIEHVLNNRHLVSQVVLTVQKEFGERLAAKPGGRDYGALTCWVQYYCHVELLFEIKRTSFHPRPNVDSCCVRLIIRSTPAVSPKDEQMFFKLIRTAFTLRRKTIINALQPLVLKEKLIEVCTKVGIDLKARPETLSLQNYVDIANSL